MHFVSVVTVWLVASASISFAFPLEFIGQEWADEEPSWKLIGLSCLVFLCWPLSLFIAPFFASYYPPEGRSVDEHLKTRIIWSLFAPLALLQFLNVIDSVKLFMLFVGITAGFLLNVFTLAFLLKAYGLPA